MEDVALLVRNCRLKQTTRCPEASQTHVDRMNTTTEGRNAVLADLAEVVEDSRVVVPAAGN